MARIEVDGQPVDVKSDEAEARALRGGLGLVVAAAAAVYALFHLWTAAPFVGAYPDLIQRSVHLAFAFVLCFLLYPARPGRSPSARPSALDWLLAATSVVPLAYVILHYDWIMENPATSTRAALVLGTVLTLVALEAARRTIGLTFVALAVASVAYAYFGPYVPGVWGHRGFGWTPILETLYLSTEGILGPVTGISATLVAVFLVFGAVLYHTGGGETFVDLAKLIAGRAPGGPAKVSVFSSAFFGSISGSAVANVVVDGIFNIPLMKRMRYRPEFAAAVEATASSGGQIMPPVMGAGAFIMAELLQISYAKVAVAAAVPAILYYLGVYSAIHFEARRARLATIPPELMPRACEVLAWRRLAALVIPIGVLSGFLLSGYTPGTATFWSIVTSLVLFLLGSRSRDDLRARIGAMGAALVAGGKGIVQVATLIAAASIVIGMINMTGVGIKLSEFVIGASGASLFLALVLAMLVCLILGMGLPTTAAYVLAASVVAPALMRLGASPIAAHLFVFYFAIISAITPPVCAAVYVAAAIARADWVRTGFLATRLGLAGFIAPFMFVYSPALLLEGTWWEAAWAALTASLGVVALAGGAIGFLLCRATPLERLLLIAAALSLIKPGIYTDIAGFVLLGAVTARHWMRRPETEPEPAVSMEGAS